MRQPALREKCPNTEFYLVHIFLYSDRKKLRYYIIALEVLKHIPITQYPNVLRILEFSCYKSLLLSISMYMYQ